MSETTQKTVHTGACLCGAVTFEGVGDMGEAHACHCRDCQRMHGGPLAAVSFSEGLHIKGDVRWFSSSEWGERGSCACCGSAMFWRMKDGSYANVSVGALDDPHAAGPVTEHIFVDQAPPSHTFAEGAARLTKAEFLQRLGVSDG